MLFLCPSRYGTQVQLTTGETVTVATRERPKVYFDKDWKMTHLVNGVCSASAVSVCFKIVFGSFQ